MIPSDILDDLATRFILNMPNDERENLIRVCFQIETAYWFYLDFYCVAMKHLPKIKLKIFAQIMFEHIPSLQPMLSSFEMIMDNWIKYKFAVPCCGAIMLDKSMKYVLLVQGMSKHWSFPKGKKNQEESLINCAIREVFEETGYDCSSKVKEESFLERKIFESRCRLFVVKGVELDFDFAPHVRGEIQKAEWFRIEELTKQANRKSCSATVMSRFITVVPFLNGISKWVERERKRRTKQLNPNTRRDRKTSNETDATSSSGEGDRTASKAMEIETSFSKSPCLFPGTTQLHELYENNIQELLALDNLEAKSIDEIERGMMLDRCHYDEDASSTNILAPATASNGFDLLSLFNLARQQKLDTSFPESLWSTEVTFGDSSDYQNSLFEDNDINLLSTSNGKHFENVSYFPESNDSSNLDDMLQAFPGFNLQHQATKNVFEPVVSAPSPGKKKDESASMFSPAFSSSPSQSTFQSAYDMYMSSINRKKEQLNASTVTSEGNVFTNGPKAQLPFYYSFNNSSIDSSPQMPPGVKVETTPLKHKQEELNQASKLDQILKCFVASADKKSVGNQSIHSIEKERKQTSKLNRKISNKVEVTDKNDSLANKIKNLETLLSSSPSFMASAHHSHAFNPNNVQELLSLDNLEAKSIDEIERGMMLERHHYEEQSESSSKASNTNGPDLSNLFNLARQQNRDLSDSLWAPQPAKNVFEPETCNENELLRKLYGKEKESAKFENMFAHQVSTSPSQSTFESAYDTYMSSINRKKEQLSFNASASPDGNVFHNGPKAQLPFYYSFNSSISSSPKLPSAAESETTTLKPKKDHKLNSSNSSRRDLTLEEFAASTENTLVGNKSINLNEQAIQRPSVTKVTPKGTQFNFANGFGPKVDESQKKAKATRYNGLDINNLPKVEMKIQQLIRSFHKI